MRIKDDGDDADDDDDDDDDGGHQGGIQFGAPKRCIGAPVNHELHHLHCCGSSPFCDPSENEFMANVWRNGCKILLFPLLLCCPFYFRWC